MKLDLDLTGIEKRLSPGVFQLMTRAHVLAFQATRGMVGGHLPGGGPMLLLHHVGRRSGKERTTPLLYLPDGERNVIIASRGGSRKHPAWYLNLEAEPDVSIDLPRKGRKEVRARTASAEERAELWPRITSMYSGYAEYQERTSRQIPVVILDPR
jgi:deazaflavin-dependent oxidoreductase (nitroreductase family)